MNAVKLIKILNQNGIQASEIANFSRLNCSNVFLERIADDLNRWRYILIKQLVKLVKH